MLVAISGFMSATEIALFSLTRFQLRSLKERSTQNHRKIKRLLSDPSGLLITILVLNEIVNISTSSLITQAIDRLTHGPILGMPEWIANTFIGTLVTTPIILFIGEITPKVIASRINQVIAPLHATPVTWIYNLFKPIRILLKKTINYFATISGGEQAHFTHGDQDLSQGQLLKESDFLLMVEEGHRSGAIRQTELDLIQNVFELDDTPVCDICTPLSKIRSIPPHTPLKTALFSMRGLNYSRIPILTHDRKQVLGILYSKDLLRAKLDPTLMDLSVESVMKKPLIVNPHLRLHAVFRKFKQQKTHMAIVQDGNNPPVGIITMNDIFVALFEDLLVLSDPDDDENSEPSVRGKTP